MYVIATIIIAIFLTMDSMVCVLLQLSEQVYGFGGVSVVIEVATSVLRAHVNDRWTPMSMESLLMEANRR